MSAVCVSWDFRAAGTIIMYKLFLLIDLRYAHTGDRGNWTDRGCETEYTPGSCRVLCKCSHLTNFAALVVSLCMKVSYIFTDSYFSRTFAPGLMMTVG